ncbi:hypothetical protein ACE1SV_14010 [Streptomyces sennicomposti]
MSLSDEKCSKFQTKCSLLLKMRLAHSGGGLKGLDGIAVDSREEVWIRSGCMGPLGPARGGLGVPVPLAAVTRSGPGSRRAAATEATRARSFRPVMA